MSKFVTAKEARKLLGISSATLMRWRESGKIPSMQVSKKKILYDLDNISNKEEADGELQFARTMAASSGKAYDGVYEWLRPIADVTPCRNLSYIAPDGSEQCHRVSNPQYENGKVDAVETRQWNPGNARQEVVYAIINKVYEQCANSASHAYEIPIASQWAVGEQIMKFMEDNPYHMPPTAIICSKQLAERLNGDAHSSEEWFGGAQSMNTFIYQVRKSAVSVLVGSDDIRSYVTIPAYIWDAPAGEGRDWCNTHFAIVRSKPHESGVKLVMGLNPIKSVKMQEVPINEDDAVHAMENELKQVDSLKSYTYGKTVSVSIDVNASVQTVGEPQCTLVEYKSAGKTDKEISNFVWNELNAKSLDGMANDGSISVDIPQFEVPYEDLCRLTDEIQRSVRMRMPGYTHVKLAQNSESTTVTAMLMSVGGVGDNPADFKAVKTD